MPTWDDVHAFARLDREIKRWLFGDGKSDGLFKALMAGNFESVVLTRGKILAFEAVLKEMDEIARAMNNEDRQAEQPPRMN